MLSLHYTHVFVYGTLKPGGTYWPQFCAGKVIKIFPAKVSGILYALVDGYPALVETDDLCWVYGMVLVLNNEAALHALDQLENFQPNRAPVDNEYYRIKSSVYTYADQYLGSCWVYYMARDKVNNLAGIYLPQGEWNERIQSSLRFAIKDCQSSIKF